MTNKRDLVLSLLDEGGPQTYIPAAFFLHFDPQFHRGQAAVDKHLAYFHATDMDVVKVQYEHTFPHVPGIETPADWANLPLYQEDFFAEPLAVVDGLVKAAKAEALVLVTLYSPYMCAGHAVGGDVLDRHLLEDPEQVKPGLEIVTESLMAFVRGCIDRGVDGFYMSSQGGESGRFANPSIFTQYIKPTDLIPMTEIDAACEFNILHVCDYHMGYDSLTPFLDYPGDVVNVALQVDGKPISSSEAAALFGRPFMGGVDRHGAIARGDKTALQAEVGGLLADKPERFVLGADCTIPSETGWDVIRLAIDTAHGA
jgi:uroporphyrinogen decarboxylase